MDLNLKLLPYFKRIGHIWRKCKTKWNEAILFSVSGPPGSNTIVWFKHGACFTPWQEHWYIIFPTKLRASVGFGAIENDDQLITKSTWFVRTERITVIFDFWERCGSRRRLRNEVVSNENKWETIRNSLLNNDEPKTISSTARTTLFINVK